jgi:hypothetical protein
MSNPGDPPDTASQAEEDFARLAAAMEAVHSVSNPGGTASHVVEQTAPTHFTWDYRKTRPALADLYRRAVRLQWDGADELPWETPVDHEKLITESFRANPGAYRGTELAGTVFPRWGEAEWVRAGIELQNWTISQFLHGEQGALVCAAKLVETVPWIDAKYYAATQVMDEARHVDIFSRYLSEKMTGIYPINPHLDAVLESIVSDSRWDLVYLGMQTMVEGMALASFHLLHGQTTEPLLKALLHRVITDEARHVAFGVLSLSEFYRELSLAEIRERQEFAYEAVIRLRDRYLHTEAWERLGVPRTDVVQFQLHAPARELFSQLLMSKIVPQCQRIGLLDAGDGWLRARFDELGISYLEDLDDGSGGLGEDNG